jgi:transcription initiation factor TFIIIB Brf1 subunit/transcription initiation factor TFIIB
MDDFELFNNALDIYNKNIKYENEINKQIASSNDDNDECYTNTKNTNTNTNKIICKHVNINEEAGVVCCTDCGCELEKSIYHDKEWRYYGQADNKRNSDPNRVHLRKIEERNIFKDVENMGFSEKIVSLANELYLQVTKGNILRGNSRRSVVFACIYHAFKVNGKPQTHDKLVKIFSLNRKTGLKGLKIVNLNVPSDSIIHTSYITPINLLEDIMDKFNAKKEHKEEVIELYNKIKNKSSKINRSRPQSVTAGLVYFWICTRQGTKGVDITLKEFASKTDLSELTIKKITKEISDILDVPILI